MRIEFYYWAAMCPLNVEMQTILRDYQDHLDLKFFDISQDHRLAKKMQMYYPTLTVLNDSHRFYSPIRRSFLDAVCSGLLPKEQPYRPMLGRQEYSGSIVPITQENYHIACRCTGQPYLPGCANKAAFLQQHGIAVYGFINQERGKLLGGAEYMPSLLVPYDIPRDEKTAFITCVYLSDGELDYKTAPLKALEQYLAEQYDRVIVVSEETGVSLMETWRSSRGTATKTWELSIKMQVTAHCI